MFRAVPRLIARPAVRVALPRSAAPARRCLSTAPPAQKSRSWKNLVARLGVAGAVIYYYNTTDIFAEEPNYVVHSPPEAESESETLPTIEAIAAERQKRKAVQAQLDAQAQKEAESKQQNATPASGGEGGIEDLEEEADQQGAFNPETGEINWDCPCLGGMAHGPCGEEFKAAFSCFVFSQEEPKGMDCIDKFKNMQNCFRQYPEVYGSELDNDDEEDVAPADLPNPEDSTPEAPSTPTPREKAPMYDDEPSSKPHSPEKVAENRRELGLVPEPYKPSSAKIEEPVSESVVPKAAHDSTDANDKISSAKK